MPAFLVTLLSGFLFLLGTTSALEAADKAKKNTFRGNRYLFIVENSSSMKRRDEALRQTMFDFINAGFRGRMQAGDEFGVWTFNAAPETKFPLQVWTPANRLDLATKVNAFLRSQGYERRSNTEKLWHDLNSILENVSDLTVILLTSGEDPISGTPFDREINQYYKQNASTLNKAKEPVTTALLLRGGKFVAYSVLRSGDPLTLPPTPDQGRTSRTASATPQEPTELLDPSTKPSGSTNNPPRRTASIIINKQTISSNRDLADSPPPPTPPPSNPAPSRPTPSFTPLPTAPNPAPTQTATPSSTTTETTASKETSAQEANAGSRNTATTPSASSAIAPTAAETNTAAGAAVKTSTNTVATSQPPTPAATSSSFAQTNSTAKISDANSASTSTSTSSPTNSAVSPVLAMLKPIGETASSSSTHPISHPPVSSTSPTAVPAPASTNSVVGGHSPKSSTSTNSSSGSLASGHAESTKAEWTNSLSAHLPNLTSSVAAPHPVVLPGGATVTAHARSQSRSNAPSGAVTVGIASGPSAALLATQSKTTLIAAGAVFIVAGLGCWVYIRRSRQALSGGSFISRALPRTGRPYNKSDGSHPS